MKKILLILLLCMTNLTGYSEVSQPTSKGTYRVVLAKVVGRNSGHLAQQCHLTHILIIVLTHHTHIR